MMGRSNGDVPAWLEAASKGERFAHGMLAVPPRLFAAEAKRARKAAKRRRDVELTRLGRELCGLSEVRTWDVRRTSLAFDVRDLARYKRRARRRGVRQWWKVTARCLPPKAWATRKMMQATRRGDAATSGRVLEAE